MTLKKQVRFCLLSFICCFSASLAADDLYTLRVDGITCPFCAYGLEKGLLNSAQSKHIEVDFDSGVISVITTADSRPLTESEMEELVDDAGYTLREFQYRADFSPPSAK